MKTTILAVFVLAILVIDAVVLAINIAIDIRNKSRTRRMRKERAEKKAREEQDTGCDKCWMLHRSCIENGLVMECTRMDDMRTHYIPIPGGHCPGFIKEG